MMRSMKNVAVFFGGQSPEHDISILTGVQAFHAFDISKYVPIPVYVTREGLFYTGKELVDTQNYKDIESLLSKSKLAQLVKKQEGVFLTTKKLFGTEEIKIDIAFCAFHGGMGEGGGFQGYCETLGLPYTGSGVLGSTLCMDKVSMKKVLNREGIPLADEVVVFENGFIKDSQEIYKNIESKLGYPVFVKPSNGGSSIGVSRAKNKKELGYALELAFSFDAKALVEKEFHYDSEVNISCLGTWNGEVILSELEEVYSEGEFLDFENKYLKGAKSKKVTVPNGSKGMASTNRRIPAQISLELRKEIETYARNAFVALSCGGVARIDFLVNKQESKVVLVEVNTVPGSLAYYLWEAKGKSFTELINEMLNLAVIQHKEKTRHARVFASNIFKNL
jgi:D-alanine-D-alanine ligase